VWNHTLEEVECGSGHSTFYSESPVPRLLLSRWTYLYRAVDSTGETINFLLSPNRDAVAAKHFLQMAMWRAGRNPTTGDQCGRSCSLSSAISELKAVENWEGSANVGQLRT
jgi:transposase-like protein